jgi:hypothetical protein
MVNKRKTRPNRMPSPIVPIAIGIGTVLAPENLLGQEVITLQKKLIVLK